MWITLMTGPGSRRGASISATIKSTGDRADPISEVVLERINDGIVQKLVRIHVAPFPPDFSYSLVEHPEVLLLDGSNKYTWENDRIATKYVGRGWEFSANDGPRWEEGRYVAAIEIGKGWNYKSGIEELQAVH